MTLTEEEDTLDGQVVKINGINGVSESLKIQSEDTIKKKRIKSEIQYERMKTYL